MPSWVKRIFFLYVSAVQLSVTTRLTRHVGAFLLLSRILWQSSMRLIAILSEVIALLLLFQSTSVISQCGYQTCCICRVWPIYPPIPIYPYYPQLPYVPPTVLTPQTRRPPVWPFTRLNSLPTDIPTVSPRTITIDPSWYRWNIILIIPLVIWSELEMILCLVFVNPCVEASQVFPSSFSSIPVSCANGRSCANGFWCHIGADDSSTVCCRGGNNEAY